TPRRAVELAVRWGPPETGNAFSNVLAATALGSPLADALDTAAAAVPALAPVTGVLVASDRLGAPAAPAPPPPAPPLRAAPRRRPPPRGSRTSGPPPSAGRPRRGRARCR